MPKRVLHDQYFRKAKAEGYLARSAYKLMQINESKRLIRPGDRVLDLGCAPGAWLQVASELIGDRGIVVGLDLQPITHPMPDNVRHFVADVNEVTPDLLKGESGRPYDVIISDMAPKTTGHNEHELSVRLCRRVLELLPHALRPGGNLTMKVFEGHEYNDLLKDTAALFEECRGYKPKASRDVSREIYIVGKGIKLL